MGEASLASLTGHLLLPAKVIIYVLCDIFGLSGWPHITSRSGCDSMFSGESEDALFSAAEVAELRELTSAWFAQQGVASVSWEIEEVSTLLPFGTSGHCCGCFGPGYCTLARIVAWCPYGHQRRHSEIQCVCASSCGGLCMH